MYYINLAIFAFGTILVFSGLMSFFCKVIKVVDTISRQKSWNITVTFEMWLLITGTVAVTHGLIQLLR